MEKKSREPRKSTRTRAKKMTAYKAKEVDVKGLRNAAKALRLAARELESLDEKLICKRRKIKVLDW